MKLHPGQNPTFRGAQPSWGNACVGDNGAPGYWEYSKGFSSGANQLIDQIVYTEDEDNQVDHLIYPICFCMRHSVELRLKGAIQKLQDIEKLRGNRFEVDLEKSHDIGSIWRALSERGSAVDDLYRILFGKAEPLVLDIALIDATGQTFRYPLSAESNKHLTDVTTINVVHLQRRFRALEEFLDELYLLGMYLFDEYARGTFTRNLSRRDICGIARLLPPRYEWKQDRFGEVRTMIRSKYGLSATEFSRAVNLICENYEFALEIELELPVLGISEDDLVLCFQALEQLHGSNAESLEKSDGGLDVDEFVEVTRRSDENKKNAMDLLRPKLSLEFVAGIRALFYFGYSRIYSEDYVHEFREQLAALGAEVAEAPKALESLLLHVLRKTSSKRSLLESLYFLGATSIAERIVDEFGLAQEQSWLDQARSREIFRNPEVFRYAI